MPSLRRRPRGHVGWLNTQQLIVKQLASSETGDCQQSRPSADHRGQRAANPGTNEVGKQNMVPHQLPFTVVLSRQSRDRSIKTAPKPYHTAGDVSKSS